MLKLVKVFPVEIGKEGFPFKKQQESQMKVFVQKLRTRFNLLLWRWCSKSLWILFLLQIHHNFEVFGWKWGFDDISNDIFKCIQQVWRFFLPKQGYCCKSIWGLISSGNGSGNCSPICCENASVWEKNEWWYKANVFWEKMLPNSRFVEKTAGSDDININPRNTVATGCMYSSVFHTCLWIQYTSLWWLSFSLQIPWDCSQKRNFLQTPFWVRLCSYAFRTFSHSFPMWGEGSFPYSFPLIPFMPIKFFSFFFFLPKQVWSKIFLYGTQAAWQGFRLIFVIEWKYDICVIRTGRVDLHLELNIEN